VYSKSTKISTDHVRTGAYVHELDLQIPQLMSSSRTTPSYDSFHGPFSALLKYSECSESRVLWILYSVPATPTLTTAIPRSRIRMLILRLARITYSVDD
jgi:hypothetical protein